VVHQRIHNRPCIEKKETDSGSTRMNRVKRDNSEKQGQNNTRAGSYGRHKSKERAKKSRTERYTPARKKSRETSAKKQSWTKATRVDEEKI
jgi:hypothetical protein